MFIISLAAATAGCSSRRVAATVATLRAAFFKNSRQTMPFEFMVQRYIFPLTISARRKNPRTSSNFPHLVAVPSIRPSGRPDAAIDFQGRRVPVESDPLHTAAVALHGDLGQMLQQGFAVAAAALLGKDEQVFKIEPLAPHEGGEVVEKEGETDHRAVLLREDHLGGTLH